MTDYKQVYVAFVHYAASRNQADWCELWIVCNRRMAALVKTKARKLSVPLPEGDIDDVINDSTCRVMKALKEASDVTEAFISKTFWHENLHAFTLYNRDKEKVRRDEKIAKRLNDIFFLN